MVDYEVNICTGKLETLNHCGKEHFMSNLSMLLQWSPYSTEAELLQQLQADKVKRQMTVSNGKLSVGYSAPEYAIRGQSTRKADVYSFGVLLVKRVSGRSNRNT
ncbi:cysteine-rich receptor-like protein kinase 1 [Camellia sinensis]|uniref:cysteine-rich receptor-like protein kinase 1 n=1 Tax=Camellia sinensis TaxID=4442 RepID=UPI00103698F7|nr:cysteine-rich receptor-like protein kinase 1 [Camellia sinensis]